MAKKSRLTVTIGPNAMAYLSTCRNVSSYVNQLIIEREAQLLRDARALRHRGMALAAVMTGVSELHRSDGAISQVLGGRIKEGSPEWDSIRRLATELGGENSSKAIELVMQEYESKPAFKPGRRVVDVYRKRAPKPGGQTQ